jgi:hypothetical protein
VDAVSLELEEDGAGFVTAAMVDAAKELQSSIPKEILRCDLKKRLEYYNLA